MTGIVQYAGRTFEYSYSAPSSSDIENRALEIQKSTRCTPEESRSAAASELERKARNAAKRQALSLLEANLKDIEEVKAEAGISQRLVTDPDKLKNTAGVVEKTNTIDSGGGAVAGMDKRVITDDTVEAELSDLVSFLNSKQFNKREKRLDAIKAKGSGQGVNDADFRADLEIPKPTAPRSPATGAPLGPQMHELAIRFGGGGDVNAQYLQEMKYLNRYGKSFLPNSRVLTGYTFITRPHCNFSTENIANLREFAPLAYAPSSSIGMAIRGYLDTELYNTRTFSEYLDACPFYDPVNPFLVPAVNALRSCTGWPDMNLSTETTEGGFFSEQQTSVIGYDRLAKGQEFALTFRDYVGQPILALHEFWTNYMGRLGDGTMHQYPTDVESNLMGYTVSIYRFIMDPTNRYIVAWAKATGCYPKLAPSGAIFNVNENEHIVQAVNSLSVQYFVHHVGYNDPIILKEFNMLVERYTGYDVDPQTGSVVPRIARMSGDSTIADGLMNNHVSLIPYISQRKGMNELLWKLPPRPQPGVKSVVADYNYARKQYNEFTGLRNNVGPLSVPN